LEAGLLQPHSRRNSLDAGNPFLVFYLSSEISQAVRECQIAFSKI
jgi:hypothetical protein